jgi:DMSO/TMAO reductase YedYZ molybdopterin-dependent catalytic subunit
MEPRNFLKDVGIKKIVVINITIVIILATFIGGLVSCSASNQLTGTEVRQYQGQNLSSLIDDKDVSIKGVQHIDINSYRLQVTGLAANPTSYTYDEIINDFTTYEKVVELDCVEGWTAKILWSGVQVKDILAKALPEPEAKVVIFHAYDGYTTSFPIEYIVNNNILMAYKMNEVTIPVTQGFPFVLVAESKWGYKWIKWITQIELSDNTSYKGYWEERGYSSSGDLNMPFIGP